MNGRRLLRPVAAGLLTACAAASCDSAPKQAGLATPPEGFVDCVDVTHQVFTRGRLVANVHRFGSEVPGLRNTARLGDLESARAEAFCDWESCLRTNGYAHACHAEDSGVERCRVCDGGDDCDGFPTSRAACVAKIGDRRTCSLGLVEDCLIQRSIRGFRDERVTETCTRSDRACRGALAGDLTNDVAFADHETDQVTIERFWIELLISAERHGPYFHGPGRALAAPLPDWEGGLPADTVLDAGTLAEFMARDF